MNVINMATPIATIIMGLHLTRYFYRRLLAPDITVKVNGISFFIALVVSLVLYVVYGMMAKEYQIFAEVVMRAGKEAVAFWIGVSFCSLMLRGYLVRSWEGLVMSFTGLAALYFLSGISPMLLPQLGDLGFWLMRFPGLGANTAYWFAMYIGLGTEVAKAILGRARHMARR
jgi:multisubunit Na+/H+ antiporter MnhF subunit